MSESPPEPPSPITPPRPEGMIGPLRQQTFRRIWLASLLSNLGLLVQQVGAAWTMTQLTPAADLVALVQTAQMLPVMLFALVAGAMADMYDRRVVALLSLCMAFAGSALLATLAAFDLLTPGVLLTLCFVIGSGTAFLWPSWQASVSEQVSAPNLPAAIALNSISYNIARSFGPAIGGAIVAAAGAVAAFGATAVLFIPLFVVLFLWKRVQEPSRLPPERLYRAVVSGVRYVANAPPLRIFIVRTLLTGLAGGALSALLPLVARDLLRGNASVYGLLLGAFGIGAVLGALSISRVRARLSPEATVAACVFLYGVSTAVVAVSSWLWLTLAVLVAAGATWMLAVTVFNIGIQLSAPRWVSGRALAMFQASIAGGVALGAWGWGGLADAAGVRLALLASGGVLLLLPLTGLWLKLPVVEGPTEDAGAQLDDPEVRMALSGRSGPIQLELEYRVPLEAARPFYRAMLQLQLARQRNGAYAWTISRDIADPEVWVEAFSCPTWNDYLRQRSRTTQAEWELQQQVREFHVSGEPIRVRRRLERPFGSVRWKEDTPDPAIDVIRPAT